MLRDLVHRPEIDLYKLILLCMVAANSAVYSVLTVLRYESYNAGILDLGVSSQLLYETLHGGVSVSAFLSGQVAMNKPIYLLMGPLYDIYPSQPLLLVFQAIWVSIGAIPLYVIGLKFLSKKPLALLVAISYLFYYPLGGVMWFDFHFMAIFPTFFLFATSYYFSGKYRKSYFMMILAIISDYLVPIIAIFFAFYAWWNGRETKGLNPLKNPFAIAVFCTGVAQLLIVEFYFGHGYTAGVASLPFSQGVSLNYKLMFFVRMMLPVLFICLLAPEFLIMIVPYFGFAVHNSYLPYVSTMFYQYPALIAPIIFVSTIIGLSRIMKITVRLKNVKLKPFYPVISFIVAINVVLMLVLTPAGQMVTGNDGKYFASISGTTSLYNPQYIIAQQFYDSYISQELSLVPLGSSILVPNNIPQVTQNYAYEISDGINLSHFPDYVLIDPYSSASYQTVFPTTPPSDTFINVTDFLISTGTYGVLAEMGGITLLKHNYNGSPREYVPISSIFGYEDFSFPTAPKTVGNSAVLNNITYGRAGWSGPYTFLIPGSYRISLNLSSNNISAGNNFTLDVAYGKWFNGPSVIIEKFNVTGTMLGKTGNFVTLDFNVHVDRFVNLVEFRAFYMNWEGKLFFNSVTLNQTGY